MKIKLLFDFGDILVFEKKNSLFKNTIFSFLFCLVSVMSFGQCLTNTTNWTGYDLLSTTGQGCGGNLYVFNGNGDMATSPIVTNPQTLTFQRKRSSNTATWTMEVEISTNATHTIFISVATLNTITALCVSQNIDLSSYNGDRVIRFRDTRPSGAVERTISDISLICGVSCSTPSNPVGTISSTPACGSTSLTFSDLAPTGVKYFWQTTAAGTSETNQTTSPLLALTSGTYYVRAKSDAGNCWSTGTISQAVTVVATPNITAQPTNQSVTEPATATFGVTASNPASYQWQVSTDGVAWNNVSSGTGGTTNSYTTSATSLAMNGYQYKVVITGNSPCATIESAIRTLTVSGFVAPSISSTLSKSSVYGTSDTYTITASNSPSFYNATGLPAGLTLSGNVISGIPSATVGSYNVSISATNSGGTDTKTLVWGITARPLTISGLTGTNREYNGGISASFTGTATLNNLVFSDAITLSGTITANFGDKNIGTLKPITVAGYSISGTKAVNYTLSQPSLTASITTKPLTVSGAAAQNKVYDGLTLATITGGTLVGVISPDAITISGNGNFTDANVGTGKAVTAGLSLSGTGNTNYSLTQPAGLNANITAATPIFTTSAINLIVGGNYTLPGATISSTSAGTFSYGLSGAAASLSGTTLTGVSVGTETLTVNQAANGNYSGGSTTVVVNVSLVSYSVNDFRTTSNGTWSTQTAGSATWEKWNGTNWVSSTRPTGSNQNAYIRHTITSNGNSSLSSVIIEGPSISESTPGGIYIVTSSNTTATTVALSIKSGGKMTANNSINNSGIFEIEDNGEFILNYAATNQSTIWGGTEYFYPNSMFIIKEWGLNAMPNDGRRTLFNGTNISTNTHSGYTAAFGNLTIDLSASVESGSFIVLSGGITANLTHKNLNLLNPMSSGNINILGTGGLTISGIGGNFIVNDLYSSSRKVIFSTSSALEFTIKGDLQLDGATTCITSSTVATAFTVNVEGNLNITENATLDFISANTANPLISLNLKGELKIANTGLLYSHNAGATQANYNFNFVGNTIQKIDIASSGTDENNYIYFNIKSGAYVQLTNRDFELGLNSKLTVENGGTLDFGFTTSNIPLNVKISGSQTGTSFEALSGSTLKITSDKGINLTGTDGNVLTTNRTFNPTAIYHYIGKTNQVTGSGLPTASTAKFVICELENNTFTLTPSQSFAISNGTTLHTDGGKLEIRKGIFIETPAATITGTGRLVMTDGVFKSTVPTVVLPALSNYSKYSLTGGTVELSATSGNQVLSGTPAAYHNLTFSGANILGTDDKKLTGGIVVNNELKITGSAIFNSENRGVTGLANVNMDGGRWRNSKVSNAQPELTGSYSFTGGTMEFYGSITTNNQVFKGGLTYNNIDVNADFANTNYSDYNAFYNVSSGGSFIINGNLNVYAPAVFKLDSTENVSGSGNIYINAGSTLLYGSANGIKTAGTTTSDGAIRVSGTRTFSANASYGFIGGANNMVTGNALPSSIENLYVVKYDATDDVALSNSSLIARNKIYMINGNVLTGANTFALGENTTNKGTLEYTSGFIKGTFKRWFAGTNSNDATGLFPMGNSGNENRFARINYTTAPSTGGTITASLNTTAMGTLGISSLQIIPAVGSCATFNVSNTDATGFWTMTKDATLTGGIFTASYTKQDALSTIPVCEMSLLNRTNSVTDWLTSGTHLAVSGTTTLATVSRSGLTDFSDFGFGNKKCNATKIWTGTWSGGIAPTVSDGVRFDTDYNSSLNGGSVSSCECEIAPTANIIIASEHYLEIQNGLNNLGTLTLNNSASLLQHSDDATNAGVIKMRRDTQKVFRYDFTYWSSPVENQSLHAVSPNTLGDKFYSWNQSTQAWQTHMNGAGNMINAKGYIVRAPQNFPLQEGSNVAQIYTAEFNGKPNNGAVTIGVQGGVDKWNLIGNPYPSAVDANLFLEKNLNEIGGTIYLWTHNSSPSLIPGNATYNYTDADYAAYNHTGGTATGWGESASTGLNTALNTPNGFIAAGQSFFAKGSAVGGTAVFNNAMRVVENNNQFFRTSNSNQAITERNRIWLNITNDRGAFNQILVGYIQNATNGIDRNYDGEVFGGSVVGLYSIVEANDLTIQGRALPFADSDQVFLGYKSSVAGSLKINIDRFDGLFANQNIYLEDKVLHIIHDLKVSPYQFTTAIGTFDTRFVLRYTNEILGNPDLETIATNVVVSKDKNQIKVTSIVEDIENISIYDILGKRIFNKIGILQKEFIASDIVNNQQVLMVRIKLVNGIIVTKKIIY